MIMDENMNKKRQLLIDTALTLFYAKGINHTGINEVLSVSGVAKNTLYNHFESKEALIIATLEQRHTLFIEWLTSKLEGADSDQQVITQLFTALAQWFTHCDPILGDFRGCFFINSSAEFSDQGGQISLFCKQHKQQCRDLIGQSLTNKDASLLDAICLMKEGAISTAYVSGDVTIAKKCITLLNITAKNIN